MRRTRFDDAPCPIARTTDLMGDWWTPLILRDVFVGFRRFDQLEERLGVSRNTLTQRLSRLVDDGMLERRPYQERPVRYEYVPTEKGLAFWDVLGAMWRFGEDWLFEPDSPAELMLTRKDDGSEVRYRVVDETTGERVGVKQLRIRRRRQVITG